MSEIVKQAVPGGKLWVLLRGLGLTKEHMVTALTAAMQDKREG